MFILSHPGCKTAEPKGNGSVRFRCGLGTASSHRRYNRGKEHPKQRTPHTMPSISSHGTDTPAVSPAARTMTATPATVPPMTRNRPLGWLMVITGVIGWLAS